jgi:hypothetical protein
MVTCRMNSIQEPLADAAVPPPCSVLNSPHLNRAALPANKANNVSPNAAIRPAAQSPDAALEAPRCQFLFADGRQCRMSSGESVHPIRMAVPSEHRDRGISPELSPVKKVHPQLCLHHVNRQKRRFLSEAKRLARKRRHAGKTSSHRGAPLQLPQNEYFQNCVT